eukprot:3666405-Pyramimonas_sp.AAC.1
MEAIRQRIQQQQPAAGRSDYVGESAVSPWAQHRRGQRQQPHQQRHGSQHSCSHSSRSSSDLSGTRAPPS